MATEGPWHCPTCLRSVPARVEACYCGTSREQAERVARAAEPDEPGGRLPWIPLTLVALALGLLVISLRERSPEARATPPPPAPAGTPAPREPPPLTGSPPRTGIGVPRRATPVPPPAALAPASEAARVAEPSAEPPAPEPEEDEGLDRERAEAREAFESRLGELARRRDALSERLRAWDASCGAGSSAVRPAGCVLLQEDIEGFVAEIDGGLRESEVAARRGWVPPGDRRRLLESSGLDTRTWGALRKRATAALR